MTEDTNNTFVGYQAGKSITTGDINSFIGRSAGYINTNGSSKVFLDNQAGYYETGSNKPYIDISNTRNPLIYGDFNSNLVQINGNLNLVTPVSVSDVRLKKNIQPLESSLAKVSNLKKVSYDWKVEEYVVLPVGVKPAGDNHPLTEGVRP